MTSMTLQGKIAAPRCTSCGSRLSVLTSVCGSCSYRFSAAELLTTAGGLLEAGMPRRSIRRQIAEAAAGRAPDIMQAAAKQFASASQGTRLAYLMAVQDFGDPRVIPPSLLLKKFEYCAPAVQAEIVLSLGRSDSEEANTTLRRLRQRAKNPRVLKAFDDPFFRSEVLSLKGPPPGMEPDDDEPEEEAPQPSEEQWDEDDAPEVEEVEAGEMEEPAKDSVPPPDLRLRADTGEGFEPVHVVKESVPPPIPQPPSMPETSGKVAEPIEPIARRSPTLPRLPSQDLDVSAGLPEGARKAPMSTRARAFIVLLLLMLLLGIVTVWQISRLRRQKLEEENRPRHPATQPVEPAVTPEAGGSSALSELEEKEDKAVESHILSFDASASSQHRKYPASNVGDGNPATVWQEAKGEKPIKKFLFLAFPDEVTVTRIGIVIGFDEVSGKHGDMFPLNNRLKKAEIEFSDEKVMFREFEDSRGMQYFDLSPPHRTRHIKITILDVYKGSWFYDNAIAEVEIWGHEEPNVAD
jgi:hypothetical protein